MALFEANLRGWSKGLSLVPVVAMVLVVTVFKSLGDQKLGIRQPAWEDFTSVLKAQKNDTTLKTIERNERTR